MTVGRLTYRIGVQSAPVGPLIRPAAAPVCHIGVFRDLCPALRGDLEISHLSAPLDLLLEEPLECRKPLRDSFRVIQSIDPNNEGATVEASDNTLDDW
jgi:hypothetical protein